MTSALKPSQRLSILPRLAATVQVAHAAPANGRMASVAADILAVMPAALAFVVQTGGNVDVLFGFRRNAMHRGARGDEHETQIVAETRQHFIIIARHIHVYFGGQCRADQSGSARFLQLLVYLRAPGLDLQPGSEALIVERGIRKRVPLAREHAVIFLDRKS